jgi:hypothetical protein
MVDQPKIIEGAYAKQYTDWHVKTGGFARDKTLRDEFAGLAMRGLIDMGVDMGGTREDLAREAYAKADAMLKERAK